MSSYYITDAVTATPRVSAAAARTTVPAATATVGVAAIAEVATPIPAVVATPRIAAVSVGVRTLGGGGGTGGCCEPITYADDLLWWNHDIISVGVG